MMRSENEAQGWVLLPAATRVHGLRFRHYRGEEDIPAIVAVIRAAHEVDEYFAHVSVAKERFALEHMTHMDPRHDVILTTVHDEVVAVSRLEWFETLSGERYYRSLGHVHPAWRRRGIGSAMLERNELRLGAIATAQEGDGRQVLVSWFADKDVGASALFSGHGYERVRTYEHMVKQSLDDVAVRPFPDGLEVGPARHGQLRVIWDAMVEGFRDHRGQADWGDRAYERWSQNSMMNLELVLVVREDGEIVACAQATIDPEENEAMGYKRGWLERGFIRPRSRSVRRRGLSAAMLPAILDALRKQGMTSAQLRVDAANPFNVGRVYRKSGFEVVGSSSEWHKPLGGSHHSVKTAHESSPAR